MTGFRRARAIRTVGTAKQRAIGTNQTSSPGMACTDASITRTAVLSTGKGDENGEEAPCAGLLPRFVERADQQKVTGGV
ncbi:hypothetical protein GCM10018792_49650 [Streptomyces rubradiris]|nr:hypothetical protein GCM10018792_49650 [Streptomyces rubradiris]